jgi:hypothetical protein
MIISAHVWLVKATIIMAPKQRRWGAKKSSAAVERESKPPSEDVNGHADRTNYAVGHAKAGLGGRRTELDMVSGQALQLDDALGTVLGGNAFYLKGFACEKNDFSMYDKLQFECGEEFKQRWMKGGTRLHRPSAIGSDELLNQSETYRDIIMLGARHFRASPVRSIINFYRNGDDSTSFHSDQYPHGEDITVGISFGASRPLLFEHIETLQRFTFPQENGDCFAFTKEINFTFRHAVPKQAGASGRISVIFWGKQLPSESPLPPLKLQNIGVIYDFDPKTGEAPEDRSRRALPKAQV